LATSYFWRVNYGNIYGAIYNYHTVGTGLLCPEGWHVASDADWTELTDYIAANGHSGSEGTVLKATAGWNDNGNGTDDYGFSALPGGFRDIYGGFHYLTSDANFWSSSESGSNAWKRILSYHSSQVYRGNESKAYGFSVRCVKD